MFTYLIACRKVFNELNYRLYFLYSVIMMINRLIFSMYHKINTSISLHIEPDFVSICFFFASFLTLLTSLTLESLEQGELYK